MEMNSAILSLITLFLCVSSENAICTSFDGLCGVTFEIRGTDRITGQINYTLSSQICDCPGKNTCQADTNNSSRVYYRKWSDQTITTKLTYCNRASFPVRECYRYDVAIIFGGVGPILTNIENLITCDCSNPFEVHRGFLQPLYSVSDYTCGKPTCDVINSSVVCKRVTNLNSVFGFSVISEIPCQCPDRFICKKGKESLFMFDDPTEYYCESAEE